MPFSNTPKKHFKQSVYYDSEEFRNRWFSCDTVEDIAFDCDVAPNAVWLAAKRRGFPNKSDARPAGFKYKKRAS